LTGISEAGAIAPNEKAPQGGRQALRLRICARLRDRLNYLGGPASGESLQGLHGETGTLLDRLDTSHVVAKIALKGSLFGLWLHAFVHFEDDCSAQGLVLRLEHVQRPLALLQDHRQEALLNCQAAVLAS